MTPFEARDPEFEAAVRRSFASLTLMHTLGASLRRVAPGEVDIDLAFRSELTQHHGFLAGPALTAIADVACGYAAMTLLPPETSVVTVEYKVNFLAPGRGERMVAKSRVVRPGRTVSVCAADVYAVAGGQERLVATMLATIMAVSEDHGQERARDAGQRPQRRASRGHAEEGHAPRAARRWCACGGRGLGPRLREIVGGRRSA